MKYFALVLSLVFSACATAPAPAKKVVEKECPPPEPTIETEETERYRHHLGVAYAHALLTTMNLNAVLHARLETDTFEAKDGRVLDDNLVAVRDMRTQYRVVLDQLYEDPSRKARDRALVPLIDSAFRATEALDLYSESGAEADEAAYTKARDDFVARVRELSGK